MPNDRPRGAGHYRWNDGVKQSSHGYVKVRVGVDHPLADPNGYAYEHLVVWCSSGNRRPSRDHVIHHKNGDKTDNRISNLELKRRTDHSVEHGGGISDEAVRAIRNAYASGEMAMPECARVHGIPVSRVSRIIRGETRLSAGGPISRNNRAEQGDHVPEAGEKVGATP